MTESEWLIHNLLTTIRLNFEMDGAIVPIAILIGKNDDRSYQPYFLLANFEGNRFQVSAQKVAFAHKVRRSARELGVVGIAFASEAWFKFVPRAELESFVPGSLASDAQRREGVQVTWEHESFVGTESWTAEITRDPKQDKSVLGPWRMTKDVEGQFTNLMSLPRVSI